MDAARFAHVSDLHIGRSEENDGAAAELFDTLRLASIDHIIVSGDVTDHGRVSELEAFWSMIGDLRERLTVVPGNHDRLGDDLRERLMPGPRVQISGSPGLHVVKIDSTGAHNRSWLNSQGKLLPEDIDDVESALAAAPAGALRVVTLHHHPLPLPEDHFAERISSHFKLPFADALELGWELVQTLNGKCELILHGHRHAATAHSVETSSASPTWMFNAGSSTELRGARVFTHRAGHCFGAPSWLGSLDSLDPSRETFSDAMKSTLELMRSFSWI